MSTTPRFFALAAALGGLLVSWAPAALAATVIPVRESITTHHDYGRCPSKTDPQIALVRRACLGVGSIEVFVTEGDGSKALWFGRRPIKESIDLGAFYKPADDIEWRLDKGTGLPMAAVVRYRVGASAGALTGSKLVVYRLEPAGGSCIMAVLPDGKAGAKARALIDADARGFRCGSSRREG